MAVRRPGKDDVAALARSYGMQPSDADLDTYSVLVAAAFDSYDAVEELYAGIAPQAPDDRASTRPDDADNPLGAWYVRTEIRGSDHGPLAGRTVAVKDNVAVAGVPMMNGSHTLEGFVPQRDATVVSRLLAAGATITGKAVCEDLCFSGGSHTSVTGPVRNPWDPSRTTGGSSSGSAALVAAGEVDLAIGGDQGGSIRMPAAFSGIVGHKPTHGLVPYTGAFPIELTLDHLGPMTRTVSSTPGSESSSQPKPCATTPTRRPDTSPPSAAAYCSGARSAGWRGSPPYRPARTSSITAASATVRVIGPRWSRVSSMGNAPV